jgi:ABC-type amino acid transport substrate-binding protein
MGKSGDASLAYEPRLAQARADYDQVLSKAAPIVVPRLNAALRGLTADGTLERLRKRWLGTDTSKLPVLR